MARQPVSPGNRHRVGLVGAGHICEFHVAALRRIESVELLGLYDVDPVRSQRAAQQLGTSALPSLESFRDLGADVIHVLTPPDTHADVAMRALAYGAHVLIEKPMATDVADCRRIEAAAQARRLRVCVNHSLLYETEVRYALEAVRRGVLGKLVSVDILRSAAFRPYEGGALPPQYRSAGYPFRDLGVHALYLFEAFLGPIQDVSARWASLGGDPNLFFDEWRADVTCRRGLGQFQLSWNVKPIQNVLILQGTAGVMRVDVINMFHSMRAPSRLPYTIDRLSTAGTDLLLPIREYARNELARRRKRIRSYHGLQELVVDFYRRLDDGRPSPVQPADAIPVVEWVERVARAADADQLLHPRRSNGVGGARVLVTGASGKVGRAVVKRLVECGERVRIFVRRAPDEALLGVDVCVGDLRDPAAVSGATQGVQVVIHAGAATQGDWVEQRASTVVGTGNVIAACREHGVEQLVHISSMAVVAWISARGGAPLSESSPLEPRPEARDPYTRAKLEAEVLVRSAVKEWGLPAVILRPGKIFGGGLPLVSESIARRAGSRFVVLGDGRLRPPLVYMDDVVDGILAATQRRLRGGEIIQLIDNHLPTQNEILARAINSQARLLHVPRALIYALASASDIARAALGRRQTSSKAYVMRSALARRQYRSETAQLLLDWQPKVGVERAIELMTRGDRVAGGSQAQSADFQADPSLGHSDLDAASTTARVARVGAYRHAELAETHHATSRDNT